MNQHTRYLVCLLPICFLEHRFHWRHLLRGSRSLDRLCRRPQRQHRPRRHDREVLRLGIDERRPHQDCLRRERLRLRRHILSHHLVGITEYGIVIEQDYENGSPTGVPTTGVPITDLTLEDVTGTVESTATDIYILCGSGSCSDWTWDGVDVTGGETSTKCENIPSGLSC